MAKSSNWTKNGSTHTNDRIGATRIPIDDVAPIRAFADGTGKRKYDKDDPSIHAMRKNRATTYRKFGIGFSTSSNSTSAYASSSIKTNPIADFRAGRKKLLTVGGITSISQANKCISIVLGDTPETAYITNIEKQTVGITINRVRYSIHINKSGDESTIKFNRTGAIAKARYRKSLLQTVRQLKAERLSTKRRRRSQAASVRRSR